MLSLMRRRGDCVNVVGGAVNPVLLFNQPGHRPLNWKTQIGSFPGSDRRPTFRVWWLLIFAVCWIYEQQKRDPDRRGTKPGRLTPKKWAETIGKSRASGMDERRLRRNREGRSEPPHLNRWRRRLAESMPSPGPAQPGRATKPRPWPTGAGNRRPTRRGGGSVFRGCRAA